MENDIGKSVKTFLNGESQVVVLGTEELGDLESSLAVRSTGQTDGERVELRQDRNSVESVVLVDASQLFLAINEAVLLLLSGVGGLKSKSLSLSDRCNQARVETTREKNTIGDLGHQTLSDGSLELCSESLQVDRGGGDVGRLDQPLRGEVLGDLVCLGVVNMAGREGDDVVADRVQALELGSEEDGARGGARATEIEGGDTDRVSGGDDSVLLLVVENPREHAVEELGCVDAMLQIL